MRYVKLCRRKDAMGIAHSLKVIQIALMPIEQMAGR